MTLFGYLIRDGVIATDWFAEQVAQADRTDGDIDTLSARIAHIRTWTFVANRPDWLADPEHWQGVTRAVEDKLSDALHERLTERFVDRRTSVLMRRLRENASLEPHFNKSGEVVVEGHVIGRLDGFTFVADASSGGSEAKALHNAAQKALAGEIAARAARVAEAPDEQFVLAADGAIRWTGAPIGKLIAGEEVLRPRLRIIADEHLTGAPRDGVEARLERWLKAHIEKLLGPLFELSAAQDITGIARGVAFQLVEGLGVLDRQKVADEVKGLEQPARATLRKYGVRFGAYHIYVPALLKPAPRALAVQLWALAHAGPQANGLDDLLHLAGSGRTSIPVNRDIDADLYRTAGYRVCGERAVRVDILERLADLIRPALAWREGAPGARPPGAFPGGGFTVFNSMTSLIGASGEDFASILRSLGYRMERRPKPAEPAPVATAVAPPAASAATAPAESTEGSAPSAAAAPSAEAEATAEAEPTAEAAPSEEAAPRPAAETTAAADESAAVDAAVESSAPEEAAASASEPAAAAEAALPAAEPSEATAGPAAETVAAAAAPTPSGLEAEPALVEVWRPGRAARSEGRKRPHFRRRDAGGPSQRPDRTQAPAAMQGGEAVSAAGGAPDAAAPVAAADTSAKPERHSRQRRRHGGEHRPDRPPRERERPQNRPQRFERREKAPDPNSPFAKLAALKAQLEAEAKERR